jgi:hypothetical protein
MMRLLFFFLLLATALPTFAARQRPETPEAIAQQISNIAANGNLEFRTHKFQVGDQVGIRAFQNPGFRASLWR